MLTFANCRVRNQSADMTKHDQSISVEIEYQPRQTIVHIRQFEHTLDIIVNENYPEGPVIPVSTNFTCFATKNWGMFSTLEQVFNEYVQACKYCPKSMVVDWQKSMVSRLFVFIPK